MKRYRLRNTLRYRSLIVILALICTTLVACWGSPEPSMHIIIENQTQQVLTIYYDSTYKVGDVEPGMQIKITNASRLSGKYTIKAKNALGETVFSKIFTWDNMQEIEINKIYKVVIPTLEKESTISDNATQNN